MGNWVLQQLYGLYIYKYTSQLYAIKPGGMVLPVYMFMVIFKKQKWNFRRKFEIRGYLMEFQRHLWNSVQVLFKAVNAFNSINWSNELAMQYSLMEFGIPFWKTM